MSRWYIIDWRLNDLFRSYLSKKFIVLALIFLFILFPFHQGCMVQGNILLNTIYVDNDNTVGPWDGTIEHPFQFIQDAVDAAVDGDTVFVYSGVYYEQVFIDKSITLQGEDKNSTVIDGKKIKDVSF